MKVLMISTDRKIFEEQSDVRSRMTDYGLLFDELHIIVFTSRKAGYCVTQIKSNVWAHPTNSRNRWFYIFDAARLGEEMVKNRESWMVSAQDPFETGLVAWWVAFYNRLKFQIQIHTDLFSPYFKKGSLLNRLRLWLALFLLPRANCIRVVSERIKRSLGHLFLKCEPVVLPIFSEIKESKKETIDLHKLYPEFDFLVLAASRLTSEKNIKLAIAAVAKTLKTSSKKIGLVIVGNGPQEKNLKRYVERNSLKENIKFESWSEYLTSYYQTADLFLLSSNFEGYCRTLIEAASNLCPILTTDVGLVGESLNKENCLICPVGDVECLAVEIKKASEGEIDLNKMAELAKQATEREGFSKKDYLSLYLDTLEKCCNGL